MFPSQLLKVFASIKEGYLVNLNTALVVKRGKEPKTDEILSYLLVQSSHPEKRNRHLQVFNQNGQCVFSGTDADTTYMMEPSTEPVIDVDVIKDETFAIWANKHGFWNYEESDRVIPEDIYLMNVTQGISTNPDVYTIFMRGGELCQTGECRNCDSSIISDVKNVTCPKCLSKVGLT